MRTKEQLSEKTLRVKAVENENEKYKDDIYALETRLHKKEEALKQQESEVNRLRGDVETFRDSFSGSNSARTKGTSSYNDMEQVIQGFEETIRKLNHEI